MGMESDKLKFLENEPGYIGDRKIKKTYTIPDMVTMQGLPWYWIEFEDGGAQRMPGHAYVTMFSKEQRDPRLAYADRNKTLYPMVFRAMERIADMLVATDILDQEECKKETQEAWKEAKTEICNVFEEFDTVIAETKDLCRAIAMACEQVLRGLAEGVDSENRRAADYLFGNHQGDRRLRDLTDVFQRYELNKSELKKSPTGEPADDAGQPGGSASAAPAA